MFLGYGGVEHEGVGCVSTSEGGGTPAQEGLLDPRASDELEVGKATWQLGRPE